MKMEVEWEPGTRDGLDSSARIVVVPIERSFWPDFFSPLIFAAVEGEILYDSECI